MPIDTVYNRIREVHPEEWERYYPSPYPEQSVNRRDYMNLRDTIKALETNNIDVALDVGVHSNCDIQSNCPLAIELRKIIGESGVTLPELLEGFAALSEADPEPPVPYVTDMDIDGKVEVEVLGNKIELDLTDYIEGNVKRAFTDKILMLNQMKSTVQGIANQMYHTYLQEIRNIRNSETLPALSFSDKELFKAGCLMNSAEGLYYFYFPRVYEPELLYNNGTRYRIAESDRDRIRRDVYIRFGITKEHKFMGTFIYKQDGNKLIHYHGRSGDCWGQMKRPTDWDGTLTQLTNYTREIMGSLATINMNSPMEREPAGMPHMNSLRERATELGQEGVITPSVEEFGTPDVVETQPRTWGGRQRHG